MSRTYPSRASAPIVFKNIMYVKQVVNVIAEHPDKSVSDFSLFMFTVKLLLYQVLVHY